MSDNVLECEYVFKTGSKSVGKPSHFRRTDSEIVIIRI